MLVNQSKTRGVPEKTAPEIMKFIGNYESPPNTFTMLVNQQGIWVPRENERECENPKEKYLIKDNEKAIVIQ